MCENGVSKLKQMVMYNIIDYFIRIIFISTYSIYFNFKLLNIKEINKLRLLKIVFEIIIVALIGVFIRFYFNIALSMIILDILISVIFSKIVLIHCNSAIFTENKYLKRIFCCFYRFVKMFYEYNLILNGRVIFVS